jgi:hypothetical protein
MTYIGGVDQGFYFVSRIVPTTKYFETTNMTLPAAIKAQEQYFKEKKVEFVIYRTMGNLQIDNTNYRDYIKHKYLGENYHFIRAQMMNYEHIEWTYVLLQKN